NDADTRKQSMGTTILIPIEAVLGLLASGIIIFEGRKEEPYWIPVGCGTSDAGRCGPVGR
ncbi:MAG: hypothetical protein QF619_06765, partial [Candidatus Binatia bacterium]|nr:hypothetical protein [Candidatus Binatia bacterium]